MHEVSLMAELVEECEHRAAGEPVRLVRVRHASSINDATLQQAFRALTWGSCLADARLQTESFAMDFACQCGFSGVLGHEDLIGGSVVVCPACGDVTNRQRTAELELISIEMRAVATGPR